MLRHLPLLCNNVKVFIRFTSSCKQLIGVTHQVDGESLGLFRIPDLNTPNDFMRLSREKISNAQEIVKEIIDTRFDLSPLQIIYKFDRFVNSHCMCRLAV